MKPATKMMSYQKSPPSIDKDDDDAALLFGTTILSPTTTTMGRRLPKWMMTGRSLGLVAVGAVLMLLAGAVLMQDESYDYSSGSFAPTRKAFMAQYPELIDQSSEEQDFQYQAYLLSLNGMLSEELDGDPFGLFSCCLDEDTSTGCRYEESDGEGNPIDSDVNLYWYRKCLTDPSAPDTYDRATKCEFAGHFKK